MNQYSEKTLEEMKKYYEEKENGHNIVSKIIKKGIDGYIAHSALEDRTCFVVSILDSDANLFTINIYPSINVAEPYRHMFSEYCNRINETNRIGFFKIQENGNVYITETQDVSNSYLTCDVVKQLEVKLLHLISIYAEELDKAAHGMIPNLNISMVIKKHFLRNLGRIEKTGFVQSEFSDSTQLFDDLDETEISENEITKLKNDTEEKDISIESLSDLLHVLANSEDE